jgi:hypothetical protein
MKIKKTILLAILTTISIATAEAQYSTNTLSFSGASWNDGGSLDGYFTIEYDLTGTPIALLSLDVVTGNGTSDGFLGNTYIYNVSGQADTAGPGWFDDSFFSATQNGGAPANEIAVSPLDNSSAWLFLDWQGSTPTSLFVGDVGSQFSSESYSGDPGTRSLNNEGGSAGVTPTPEPATFALAGLGGMILIAYRRRGAKA